MCVTKGNWKTLIIYKQVEKTLGLPEIVSKGREGISPPSESDQQIKLLYDYALSNDFCSEVKVLVTQSCLPLCDPMDRSPPSSSVHGIFLARKLEWVAIPSSQGSS